MAKTHLIVHFALYATRYYEDGEEISSVKMPLREKMTRVVPSTWSVEKLHTYGFWLDENFEPTDQTIAARYFIAPASVLGAERVNEEE